MSDTDIIYIALFILFVILSSFFAASEIAFMSLQRFKLEGMLQKNVRGARLVARLKARPEQFLSTVLLGNNLVNTAAAAIGTALAVRMIQNDESAVLVATIIVTVVLLIFGDAIPKTSAAHHAEKIALVVAPSIRVISVILTPFVLVLSWITSGFGKLLGARPVGGSLVSEEEIRAMITAGKEEGTFEKAEVEMLHKVFEFGDRPAREVMVPRTEVTWIEKGTTIGGFFKIYVDHPYTRYPVYEDKRDNVVGIISSKDLLMSLAKGACDTERTIDDIIRPAYFAPENKRINDLLTEMRAKSYHMCVVIDEYGGTSGIITLTQLVEEIVGDVKDEMSAIEKDYEIINDTTFQVGGSMRIEDINEEMHLAIPEGDYETVAGFILNLLGHIPKTGEQIRYRDLKLVVTRMEGLKIEEILVTREKHAAAADKV
ncbi:MAG: hemolysin family protein [Dehalococcoidales bacterium]|nr:hemolysin family protein [Dehalococcoidales bacterium]